MTGGCDQRSAEADVAGARDHLDTDSPRHLPVLDTAAKGTYCEPAHDRARSSPAAGSAEDAAVRDGAPVQRRVGRLLAGGGETIRIEVEPASNHASARVYPHERLSTRRQPKTPVQAPSSANQKDVLNETGASLVAADAPGPSGLLVGSLALVTTAVELFSLRGLDSPTVAFGCARFVAARSQASGAELLAAVQQTECEGKTIVGGIQILGVE